VFEHDRGHLTEELVKRLCPGALHVAMRDVERRVERREVIDAPAERRDDGCQLLVAERREGVEPHCALASA
jgi:hypothetical protein